MSSNSVKPALRAAVQHLLTPLVRMLLRAGIGVGEFDAIAKTAYVQAAVELAREKSDRDTPVKASHIALQTGLPRAQVAKILRSSDGRAPVNNRYGQRIERVLAGWWNDPDFQEKDGSPAALPVHGLFSLQALVRRHSGGGERVLPILEELLRAKAVGKRSDGLYEPISRSIATVDWSPEGIVAMGEQVHDLIATLAHNMQDAHRPRYVRRVLNSQLNASYAALAIRDLAQHADRFCDLMDDALNDSKRTVSAANQIQKGVRVGIEVFVIESAAAPHQTDERDLSGG